MWSKDYHVGNQSELSPCVWCPTVSKPVQDLKLAWPHGAFYLYIMAVYSTFCTRYCTVFHNKVSCCFHPSCNCNSDQFGSACFELTNKKVGVYLIPSVKPKWKKILYNTLTWCPAQDEPVQGFVPLAPLCPERQTTFQIHQVTGKV